MLTVAILHLSIGKSQLRLSCCVQLHCVKVLTIGMRLQCEDASVFRTTISGLSRTEY